MVLELRSGAAQRAGTPEPVAAAVAVMPLAPLQMRALPELAHWVP
jgi:hypothetical protein